MSVNHDRGYNREIRAWLGAGRQAETTAPTTVGAFVGLPSAIYLLTHLGVLWAEQELLDEATELVEVLPPLISTDDYLDVIQGSAGCLLSLLSLHAVRPASRTLDVANQCGDRLVATAQGMSRGVAWTTLPGEPPLGGFSLTFLRLEIRRLLRNRRTVIFTLVMPPLFFFAFGTGHDAESAGRGNVTAYIMISLAVYGAMIATTGGGAMVGLERAVGWSRQLRLTPLNVNRA